MTKHTLCRVATPFTRAGALDEDALRALLGRLAEAGLGICLGNAGAGEGHALTDPERERIYRIGVEACKGKTMVYADPPEQATARDARSQLKLAADAGVEAVVLYGPGGRHGYKPTDGELTAYYDEVLSAIRHPVALAADVATGYVAKAALVARACEKYSQVRAIHLGDVGEDYLLDLKGRLKRAVDIRVPSPAAPGMFDLGAAGVLSAEANIIPRTYRHYLDLCGSDRPSGEATTAYLQLKRFTQYVSKWGPSSARWLKLCMKALRLPGGEGGVREPYQMPPQAEIEQFAAGLFKLGIPEIDEQARAAGRA